MLNKTAILIIFKKEILCLLKNKEALFVMILVPIIIYPLILMIHGDLVGQLLSKKTSVPIEISFIQIDQPFTQPAQDFANLREFIIKGSNDKIAENEIKKKIKPAYTFKNLTIISKQPPLLSENQIQIIFYPEKTNFKKGEIQIFFNSENDLAFVGKSLIQNLIEDYNQILLKQLLKENNISIDVLNPIVIRESQNLAPPEHFAKKYGGAILAILLIFLTYVSCQYAATEVMPAEREQMTLETLLATPLHWHNIIIGKYLAIVTAGFCNALLNLFGMVLFGGSIISIMANLKPENFQFHIPFLRIAMMLFALIPLAFMCAGVALFLISFARTRMSASYLSIPGMLLVVSPAMLVLLPNVQLQGIWVILPFANITLFIRNLFIGDLPWLTTIAVLFNVSVFSIIITFFSIIISNHKDKILSGGMNFSLFYRPKTIQNSLSLTEGVLITIISFVLFILIGQYLQSIKQLGGIGIPLSFFITLFVPAYGLMVYKKINIEYFLNFHVPSWQQIIGAILFVIPMAILSQIINIIILQFVPELNANEEMQKIIIQIYEKNYFWGILFIIAVTPGIFEEFIMRGILFHSIKKQLKPFLAILITGVAFGFVHGFLRMLPIIPLGICLTWLVYRTKSLWVPMIVHTLFNTLSLILMINPKLEKKLETTSINLVQGVGMLLILIVASYLSIHLLSKYPHKYTHET